MKIISTHAPLARRDLDKISIYLVPPHFYSRASCEARLDTHSDFTQSFVISTHAPLARRDFLSSLLNGLLKIFLLTRLLRGATMLPKLSPEWIRISTHAPLARRDLRSLKVSLLRYIFLLTRLLRGATVLIRMIIAGNAISTHAPLARRDRYN